MGIAPVEVDPVRQIETADRIPQHLLRETDGVGGGHENDLALDTPLGLEPDEALAQMMRHNHAGDLVRVKRSLDVDPGARAGFAEALDRQRELGSGRERREGDAFCSHDV
jgi:hypothetical protein